jgi:hypothetical protein
MKSTLAYPRLKSTRQLLKTFGFSALTFFASVFPFSIAVAGEFQENAMCISANPDSSFPRISIQTDPANAKRGILILYASDGWTQVYSGPMKQDTKSILFREDKMTVQANFSKDTYSAKITFNGDVYRCDERSFGN